MPPWLGSTTSHRAARTRRTSSAGKGANLAEMTNLGPAGPAGLHDLDRDLPRLPRRGRRARGPGRRGHRAPRAPRGRRWASASATPTDPLLVSVRSGAKFSMPGMMETVLNVGLNDTSVGGLAARSEDERFAQDSYRRLLQMFGGTVLHVDSELFSEALDEAKRAKGTESDLDLDADDLRGARRRLQGDHQGADRPRLPAGPARAARPRHPRGLRLLEHRPRPALPPPGADPRGPRHRRQRPGDGLRQLRHGLRLRRRVHPRPRQRRAGRVRRLPAERPGRGRRRRHPQHRARWPTWPRSTGRRTTT